MSDPADGDRALVESFLETRSEKAFRTLFRRHAPRLWGLVLRLTAGRESEAEDAFQETWLRAVRGLPGFRWEAALSTWLCGIAVNCVRERRREEGRAGTVPLDRVDGRLSAPGAGDRGGAAAGPAVSGGASVVSGRVEPERPVVGSAAPDPIDVERALARLPDGYRTVLLLWGVYGYTHAEIGKMLGISEGTSKSQLSRGRRALEKTLAAGALRTPYERGRSSPRGG